MNSRKILINCLCERKCCKNTVYKYMLCSKILNLVPFANKGSQLGPMIEANVVRVKVPIQGMFSPLFLLEENV
jgi:uncharacterized membrane protein YfbV (UPF0208 family)